MWTENYRIFVCLIIWKNYCLIWAENFSVLYTENCCGNFCDNAWLYGRFVIWFVVLSGRFLVEVFMEAFLVRICTEDSVGYLVWFVNSIYGKLFQHCIFLIWCYFFCLIFYGGGFSTVGAPLVLIELVYTKNPLWKTHKIMWKT